MFTIFAIVSLAVGVGVTTAVYSVVDRIFWKDLGIAAPETVALVMGAEAGSYDARRVMSEPDFADVQKAQTSFSALSSARSPWSPAVSTEVDDRNPRPGEAVDGAYFSLLGVTPAMGRLIQPADDTAGC